MNTEEQQFTTFILIFVFPVLFILALVQIQAIMKSRRVLKYESQIKVGGVITKKIPQPEMPSIPPWGNMLMENRVTGQVLPVCADKTGFWHLGGEGTDPVKLSLREWTIRSDGE